jgi:uncharacterized protein YndB with AHSA1/START domain
MAIKNKPNELYITRVYDAPVKLVWDAWVDPKQVAQWWGPRGFTITSHSKDVRTGGHWNYTMHGPDGVDYPNTTKFLEVEKYSRMVYDHGGYEDRPPMFRVTVEFSEKNGKTKMEMTMAMASAEALTETKKIIKQANGNSTWDRLAEFLAKETTGKEEFVINRSFHTSVDTMYDMWMNPKHFEKWLGPTGSSMTFKRAEIRPGGSSFYAMTTQEGTKMYGRIHYQEMQKPNKLVYTQEFTDEKENPARHPMAPTWPKLMRTTVVFAEEGPNDTRVTVTWEVWGNATREEMETFLQARAGMSQGWGGSFDRLEEYLAKG